MAVASLRPRSVLWRVKTIIGWGFCNIQNNQGRSRRRTSVGNMMFAWQYNAFPLKLAQKSITHDRIWNITFRLSQRPYFDYNTLQALLRTLDKEIVQCFLWLATVNHDDRFDACPFPLTKQSIVDELKGVWLCKRTICDTRTYNKELSRVS